MHPTEKDIREIAELLDCGERCFFHEPTGEIEHFPDPDEMYSDTEYFQETMDKVDADWSNYLRFEKMDSRQAFQVMEDFADSLADKNFQSQLFNLLSKNKPFSKFKWAIDNSDYRQNWFDFKEQANIAWVREQLRGYRLK
ncbi:MAG: hypothetical protein AAF551_07560 [Bacteroidota bacterium]